MALLNPEFNLPTVFPISQFRFSFFFINERRVTPSWKTITWIYQSSEALQKQNGFVLLALWTPTPSVQSVVETSILVWFDSSGKIDLSDARAFVEVLLSSLIWPMYAFWGRKCLSGISKPKSHTADMTEWNQYLFPFILSERWGIPNYPLGRTGVRSNHLSVLSDLR